MAPLISPYGDGRYQVRWSENGKNRSRVFHTATDARRFHAMRLQEPVTPSIDQVVAKWAAEGKHATSTAKRVEHTCRQLLRPFFGDTPIESITPDQVRCWIAWLARERQYSASTVRQHFCVLRAAMNWAVDALIITVNPCTQVALPRVPKSQRAMALTRLHIPRAAARRAPGHHRDCAPLTDLRRALAGTATAEELTGFLRGLDIAADRD